MKKLVTSILLLVLVCLSVTGCFGLFSPSRTDKRLTTYFSDSHVVSVRFFMLNTDLGYDTEELPDSEVSRLAEKLDSMELTVHYYHTDYYWQNDFGIELGLEDGSYLVYDGTKLRHRTVSVTENTGTECDTEGKFLEVIGCNFWEEMRQFFPSIETQRVWAW